MSKTAAEKAVIDEYGEELRLARLWTPPVNPHLARVAELAAIIDGWYGDFPAEKPDTQEGVSYRLEVKPRQFERTITAEGWSKAFYRLRLLKVLDAKGKLQRFDPFTVFRTTQEVITKHLGEAFLDSIAPKQRTGRRTFEVIAKAAPALTKKAA